MTSVDEENQSATSSVLLEAKDLSKIFRDGAREVSALQHTSLALRAGEIVSIVGPSGCGKTTLLKLLAQLQSPTTGTIRNLAIQNQGAKQNCSFIFQKTLLFPWRTIAENILLPCELIEKINDVTRTRCNQMIEAVGLKGFETAYPGQVSGGMAQRANIARALINNPQIIFCDEPLSAVDELTRERLWVDFRRLWQQQGVSVLLVTHSIREAVFLSNRTLVMTNRPGRITAEIEVDLPDERSADTLYHSDFMTICETVREALVKATHGHEAN